MIIIGFCQSTNRDVEHGDEGDTDCNWCTGNASQRLAKKIDEIENQGKNQTH